MAARREVWFMPDHLKAAGSVSKQLPTVAIRAAVEVIYQDRHGHNSCTALSKFSTRMKRLHPSEPPLPFPDAVADRPG
jgi:hypothetical protein